MNGSPSIIIPCAGSATRWGNYLDRPKHLISIEGEVLVQRTIRQFMDVGDIFVVSQDDRYDLPDSVLYGPHLNEANLDVDKVLSSIDLWSESNRTIVLFGDVWFSDTAARVISSWKRREIRYFGREGPSSVTGSAWGELFGFSFWPEDHRAVRASIKLALNAHRAGISERSSLWEVYRASQGIDLNEHSVEGAFTEIDDWTEDFDFPDDYDNWIRRRVLRFGWWATSEDRYRPSVRRSR